MSVSTDLLLIVAAFGAGLMNSVAGGGTFLTFPALVFAGVPSVMANATSTVAVSPARWPALGPIGKIFPDWKE
ncbi:MAG TPA: hypothetical protein VN809_00880 [Telmatospirillum sp.]|nr:hypothetical protein [Telmatospirillum sp.]